MDKVCVDRSDFNLYLVVFICIVVYLIYLIYTMYYENNENNKKELMTEINLNKNLSHTELLEKLKEIQDLLYSSQLAEQKCKSDLQQKDKLLSENLDTSQILLNKIYNPLVAPERIYPGGRLNTKSYEDYQLIGYIYKDSERYPLYGRYKYRGRSEKWEYYLIDESRNRLKIPFKSRNDNELYDGDSITIPELGNTYNVKIYEYENFRYYG
jgi:hypothetical protein